MSDRKAQNKYVPPDFDPAKHKTINGYRNSHHLRQRANKLSEGIIVIRFEMPYHSWCLHCNRHIAQGVRFNAEKKTVGKYLSTNIYEFSMKCHECGGRLVMRTDPKNADYECVEGLRRKITTFTPDDQLETKAPEVDKEKLLNDAFYRLEHVQLDKEKLVSASERLEELQKHSDRQWKDPFEQSRNVRKLFRNDKKIINEQARKDAAFSKRKNLSIPLLPEAEEDRLLSTGQDYVTDDKALNTFLKRKAELDGFIFKPQIGKDVDITQLTQLELKRRKLLQSISTSENIALKKQVKQENKTIASLVADYSSDGEL